MRTDSCTLAANPHARTGDAELLSITAGSDETAVADAPAAEPAEADDSAVTTQPGCKNCGSTEPWGFASWCPRCGYYPAFGTCVDTGPRQDEPTDAVNFVKIVPAWMWILGAGLVAIFVGSVVARFQLPPEGNSRILWTLGQLMLGLSAALVAQITTFLVSAADMDKASPFDVFLKPIEVWKPSMRKLPAGAWRIWSLAWGMWGAFCAVVLIGGVRFSTIFDDWGIEKKANMNVVQEIVKKARRDGGDGADSLEGAMNDFVGDKVPEDESEEAIAKWPQADCLIIGYQADKDRGGFSSILVASVVDNKLSYVGMLSVQDVPEESRKGLYARMRSLAQKKPFVNIDLEAVWLKPVLMCRVAYKDWTKSKELVRPKFRAMLRDVDAEQP